MTLRHKPLMTLTAAVALLAAPAVASASGSFQVAADDTKAQGEMQTQGSAGMKMDGTSGKMGAQGALQAEKLLDMDVANAAGEEVGEIDSVLIGADGKVQAVIVGVGGFLGIGERNVAVAWDKIRPGKDDDTVIVSMTKAELEAMPAYVYKGDAKPGTAFEDSDYRAMTDSNAGISADAGAGTNSESRMAAGGDTKADSRAGAKAGAEVDTGLGVGANAGAESGAMTKLELNGGTFTAEELIGTDIVNAKGETIGEVEDIIVMDGKADSAVLTTGEFLGLGGKKVKLPLNRLNVVKDANAGASADAKVSVDMTEQQLEALPEFDEDKDKLLMR